MKRTAIPPTWEAEYGLSPGVAVSGGRTVYLSGHIGVLDPTGKAVSGDFDVQTHQVFANLQSTLERAGGALSDIVSMTVFVSDGRYSKRFTDLRKHYFPDNYPASALIVAAGFALPEILVEITAVAVLPE